MHFEECLAFFPSCVSSNVSQPWFFPLLSFFSLWSFSPRDISSITVDFYLMVIGFHPGRRGLFSSAMVIGVHVHWSLSIRAIVCADWTVSSLAFIQILTVDVVRQMYRDDARKWR